MADINLSVTHSIEFNDANGKSTVCVDPIPCLAGDYSRTYGRVQITVTRTGEHTVDALSGNVVDAQNLVQVVLAKRSMISLRDLQQSNALYEAGDTKFRLTAGDCEFQPKKGDIVTDPTGEKYEVLGVDVIVFATRYLLWCRDVT